MLKALLLFQGVVLGYERLDRWATYLEARAAADATGRPLLNIGCPGPLGWWAHPCGDVCLDLDPERLRFCRSKLPTLGDIRDIRFPDGFFGAALASHVLEHLPSPGDVDRALAELRRVSNGRVFIAVPVKLNLHAWIHPDHHLWVTKRSDGSLLVEQR